MRALVVVVALGGVARADVSAPTAGGWVRACETRLRRVADEWDRRLDFASVDLFRRWDWSVGDETIALGYRHSRTGQDYRVRITVADWSLRRMIHGRLAALAPDDPFLLLFRPALDACLER